MSYVLNHTGIPIPAAGYHVVSGADRRWYMYRVPEMMAFLRQQLGAPDATAERPTPKDFAGRKGVIVVKGRGWSNAVGHVTLWDGAICSDSCHLMADPDNCPFVPDTAALWVLP